MKCPHCHRKLPEKPHWYQLLDKGITTGFLVFVLWMFASKFDETELWVIIAYVTGGGIWIYARPALSQWAGKGWRIIQQGLEAERS